MTFPRRWVSPAQPHSVPSPRRLTLIAALTCLSFLPGCAHTGTAVTPATDTVQLTGRMKGGEQPITGSTIQLYAVGPLVTAGVAPVVTPLIGSTVQTDQTGSFSITAKYTCPSSSTQVYLVGTGGNPGLAANTDNTNIALMAALGPCGSLSSATYIWMDEVTTIGSLAALYPYLSSYSSLNSSASNTTLLNAAFTTVNQYTNTATGLAPGPTLPSGYYASSTEIDTLANAVSSCIDSPGGTAGDGSYCGNLFQSAKPTASAAPTDTIAAILDILNNPTLSVATIFAMSPASGAPFQPALASAPTNWSLPILQVPSAPTFSLATGTYTGTQSITLSDATSGVSIYYTLDGSTPTSASALYSTSVPVYLSETLNAVAIASGRAASPVASAAYVILPPTGPTQIAIQPMTTVVSGQSGYFPDPLPIHFANGINPSTVQYFSGSNKALLTCSGAIQANCFQTSSISINLGTFTQAASASGSTITSVGNNNIYQDNQGNWQMATTLHLSNPSITPDSTWSVIAHAHPTGTYTVVPTAWTVDTILVGSLSQSVKANYDGKFLEDGGNLYLIYSMALTTNPLHDGVVAQLMVSATQLDSSAPTILLEPDVTNNGYYSEFFFGPPPDAPFKLVETGNIVKIGGKYAMAYSTGSYQETDYKSGIAWSDTLLPQSGLFYQKVNLQDTTGIWGQVNHAEVLYLLQAQQSAWPNYIASQVLAPGVPSIVHDPSGVWYLYFAGYAPSDAPTDSSTGYFIPSYRRPFFVQLQIAIPNGATVAGTPSTGLATWVTTVTQ